jgi:hypothetical protein
MSAATPPNRPTTQHEKDSAKSAGAGLILALVAFVGQSIAIVLRARYVLPWIAEDIRLNRARAGGKNV